MVFILILISEIHLRNLDHKCIKCLCVASSSCQVDIGCADGFCGPFQMSVAYYLDAIQNTDLPTSEEGIPPLRNFKNICRYLHVDYCCRICKMCRGYDMR